MAVACVFVLFAPATGARASPHIDYMLHCQGCHLEDGHGVPGVMPGLREEVGRIAAVPGGRDYLLRVPGVASSPLPSDALAGVLNWVLARFNAGTLPPGFAPFTADEVAKARERPLQDPARERTRIYRAPDYASRRPH
jgi:hypothetical protein